MTVRENLEMGAHLERKRAEVERSIERVFTLFPRPPSAGARTPGR
jgi:ABC-type branched-subunit amino acid transport system ATPase component